MTHRGTLPHHPLRLRLRNDRGIALPMVLMVFIVGVALISAFLVAIVGSSQVTAVNKNIVQAQAAADAGIAAAEAHMRTTAQDPCTTDLTELEPVGGQVTYTFTPSTPNCELVDGKKRVVIRATGEAGDAFATVEASFTWVSGNSSSTMTGENILFVGGGDNFAPQNNSIQLLDPLGKKPTVTVRSGAFQCKNLDLPGGLIIGGVFTLDGPCTINGDAYFGKTVNWNSALTVTGSIKSVDGEVKPTGPVGGSIDANGAVTVSNTVGGSITTPSNVTLNSGAQVGTSATPANIVSNGNVTVNTGAKVFGDITASGVVVVESGATVFGSITAIGNITVNENKKTLGFVQGNIYSGGVVDLKGQVGVVTSDTVQRPGNVTGVAGVKVAADLVVPGRIVSGADVDLVKGNWVGKTVGDACKVEARGTVKWQFPPTGVNVTTGTCKPAAGVPAAPVIPAVAVVPPPVIPGWLEYRNTADDIKLWKGFEDMPTTGEWACANWNGGDTPIAWRNLASELESPAYFNLSGCDINAASKNKTTVVLAQDTVIVAKSFVLEKFDFVAATNTKPRLWLIQPGQASSGAPVCAGTKTAVTLKDVDIASPIVTMVYTPCEISIQNKVTFTGNVYAAGIDTQGSGKHSSISFSPIEILSWTATEDEDDDDQTTGTGIPSLGSLLVQRNVD